MDTKPKPKLKLKKRLSPGKLKAMAHYVIAGSDPARLGSIRLNKILWYVDTLHYRANGASMSGETYVKRQHGPVPEHVLRALGKLEEEDAIVSRSLSMLRQASGQAVTGWLSPIQSESMTTLDALSRHGVQYTLDWNVDDLPVRMRGDAGPVYGMPYGLDTSDKLSVLDFNLSNEAYTEQLVDAFDTLWREAEHSGGRMVTIAAHSWLTGQANRIIALRRALEIMASHSGVWATTYADALRAYKAQE